MENGKGMFCQSCAVAIHKDILGTNEDLSENLDYCTYCYVKGSFVHNVTLDKMQALALGNMKELYSSDENFDEHSAEDYLSDILPKLKRWQEDN